MRKEDGNFEEGTGSYLADRRLRELVEMIREFARLEGNHAPKCVGL